MKHTTFCWSYLQYTPIFYHIGCFIHKSRIYDLQYTTCHIRLLYLTPTMPFLPNSKHKALVYSNYVNLGFNSFTTESFPHLDWALALSYFSDLTCPHQNHCFRFNIKYKPYLLCINPFIAQG